MARSGIIIFILLLMAVIGFMLRTRDKNDLMNITSPAFEHNQSIPKKYTCDGENIHPPLLISAVPAEAKSLALIMEDPDVPKNIRPDGMWDHWLIWDMPPTTTEILEGKEPQGIMGKNSGGEKGYAGPCPPDREHRYFLKLFALDLASLALPDSASKAEVKKAMEGHILAEAQLIGRYQR